MLNGILKKVLFVLVVVVIFQNWGKIERVFNPSQAVSEQVRAQARVVLYTTEWCGYCKQIRRFLDISLRAQGYATVDLPNGSVKIVPDQAARLEPVPVEAGGQQGEGSDSVATRVFNVRNAATTELSGRG